MAKKSKGKILTRCVSYSFWKYTNGNRNNETRILYIFTGNVKPYIWISQYSFVASLCWYVYFKVFFKKEHDFVRLIFAFKKFQEMRTKSLFLSFQNDFSASYFPISQEPFDENSSLTHYGIIVESSKCWGN